MSLDRVFHLGSGLALLVLFCELAETISRSSRAPRILLLGGGGFAASLAAAIAVELLGPGALLALVLFTAGWAVAIAFAGREHGADPARADFARADE